MNYKNQARNCEKIQVLLAVNGTPFCLVLDEYDLCAMKAQGIILILIDLVKPIESRRIKWLILLFCHEFVWMKV